MLIFFYLFAHFDRVCDKKWSKSDAITLWVDVLCVKGRLSLFNLFIDMRTTVSLSISCGKNVFLLENFNKNTFFLHEMDKLTVVLMSIKWLNKKRWPLIVTLLFFHPHSIEIPSKNFSSYIIYKIVFTEKNISEVQREKKLSTTCKKTASWNLKLQ